MTNIEYAKNDYYFKEALKKEKNNLLEWIKRTKNQIEILKNIKRKHKKDGSNFQNFFLNFDLSNIEYGKMYYDMTGIEIAGIVEGYEKIYINRYGIEKDFIEKIKETNPERIIKLPYSIEKVEFTPDELMGEIKSNIEELKERLKKYEERLETIERNAKLLSEKLDFLLAFIGSSNNYYELKNIARETINHFYK